MACIKACEDMESAKLWGTSQAPSCDSRVVNDSQSYKPPSSQDKRDNYKNLPGEACSYSPVYLESNSNSWLILRDPDFHRCHRYKKKVQAKIRMGGQVDKSDVVFSYSEDLKGVAKKCPCAARCRGLARTKAKLRNKNGFPMHKKSSGLRRRLLSHVKP